MDNRPIGIFDSGLGGLTAVSEVMKSFPAEDIVYVGDTGRVPYGTRSEETILRYAKEDVDFLRQKDVKAIIVACGTVSAVALPKLEGVFDIPVTGVVKPASAAAAKATKNKKIAIIGTQATIKSGAYEEEIRKILPSAEFFSAACPLFVPLVENGRVSEDDPVLLQIAEEYLAPLRESGADTLIMGCTHYPIIEKAIAKVMGAGVALINPGREAAVAIQNIIEQSESKKTGNYRFFVSDDAEGFKRNAAVFLGGELPGSVENVNIGG